MIRFKTIEPGEAEKPVAKPAAAAPAVAPPAPEAEQAKPAPKGKGMTRKTPLRAKKAAPERLFKD